MKSGVISEAQGPWYQVQAKQLFAQDAMNQARTTALHDYLTDDKLTDSKGVPLKFSDDIGAVNGFFNNRMTGAMQGADAWQAEVMVPLAQHATNELTQQHEFRREQDRPLEMEAAFKQNIGSSLSGITPEALALAKGVTNQTTLDASNPDPSISNPARQALEAQQRIINAQSDLQHAVDNQGHTTNPVTVKKWLHDALTDASMDRRDSTMFTKFYGGIVKADGSPLDNSDAAAAHGVQLTRLVKEQKLSDARVELEQDLVQDQRYRREANIGWQNKMVELQKANPAFSIFKDVTPDIIQNFANTPSTPVSRTVLDRCSKPVSCSKQHHRCFQVTARKRLHDVKGRRHRQRSAVH